MAERYVRGVAMAAFATVAQRAACSAARASRATGLLRPGGPPERRCRWTTAPVVVVMGIVAAGLISLAAPAHAAVPEYDVFEIPSPQPQEGAFFGERMRTLGDVDGDGARDVVISSPRFDAAGDHGGVITNAGRVYVFSGRTRALLHTIDPPAPQENASFGFWSANLGTDVDGDGVADFVTSAPGQVIGGETVGQVYVYSGRTGGLIRAISPPESFGTTGRFGGDFGGNLIGPGDLSGDGVGDFVATASGAFGGSGAAYAFSGRTGELLYKVSNPSTQASTFGFGAAELGDINRDGFGDYQVGAPRFNEEGVENVGRSYIIDGHTGNVIYTLLNPEPEANARFGQADADGISLGDITGDGTPDIYVDSFLADVTPSDGGVPLENAGKVFLFDGATGSLIRRLRDPTPEAGATFGASNANAGDLDQDGRPDSLVSSRGGNNGEVTIFGGLNLETVLKVFPDPGDQVGALFGSSIASPAMSTATAFPTTSYRPGARTWVVPQTLGPFGRSSRRPRPPRLRRRRCLPPRLWSVRVAIPRRRAICIRRSYGSRARGCCVRIAAWMCWRRSRRWRGVT